MTSARPSETQPAVDMLTEAWETPPGLWGWLTAVNHKQIGRRFIITGFGFFLVGGVLALLMRTQLAVPENSFLNAEIYNQLFTMHGTTMMFLFAVPILEGLAIYLMPLMLGSRDLPFPRLNSFGYFAYLFGGLFVFSSFLVGQAPGAGWFAYVPLAGTAFSPDKGMDFWLLGVTLVEISGIVGALELVVAFFRHRSPGMSLARVPLFAWAAMVTGTMMVIAFPAIVTASTLLELERTTGMTFYDPAFGGDPLLWQHLFWFFGHPEVYIMLLPAVGMVSMIVPVFAKRAIAGYGWVVAAFVAIGLASFGLWVHHMFTVGLPAVALAFFSAASVLIAIPSGVLVFSWLATLWSGKPVFRTPLLYVVGFVVVFVIGGITGVMVGSVPFDTQVHDSFFVVAHFHYVLIGGVVFPVFAALYHWFPKWTGRATSEILGKTSFWTMFLGVNLAFFPQHFLGFQGMPRRVFTYDVGLGWELGNMLSTVGAFVLAAGIAVAVVDLVRASRTGPPAGDDPWEAGSLEWAAASPPPVFNFRYLPVVESADPLWAGTHPTSPEAERPDWIAAVAHPTEPAREVLETSPIEGEPQVVVRLPGGSPWPVATALGLTITLLGVLGSWAPVTIGGAAVLLACVVTWGAADPHVRQIAPRGDEVRPEGPVRSTSGIWGLSVGLASVSVILGSLLFAYWQLGGSTEAWPPPDAGEIPLDTMLWVGLSALAAWLAIRTSESLDSGGARVGLLAVAALLSLAAAGIATSSGLASLGPVQGSPYASSVMALVGFSALLGVLLAVGLISIIARVADRSPAGAVSFRVARISAIYVVVVWVVVAIVVWAGQSGIGAA